MNGELRHLIKPFTKFKTFPNVQNRLPQNYAKKQFLRVSIDGEDSSINQEFFQLIDRTGIKHQLRAIEHQLGAIE